MDPVFIYCDKVKFQNEDYKIFKVDFSDGDNLEGVFFRKNRDYYITSMSCFITLEQDLKELKYYDDIKKISEISNKILKNGIEHLYEEKVLEVTLENVGQKIEFQPDKSKRGLSVHAVEFFDEESKTKRLVYVYSPYEELKTYGLNFENKGKSVYKYTIDMIEENNKLYLEKKLFFDKKKAIDEIVKETDRKNVLFMKYNGELYAFKFELSRYYYEKLNEAPAFNLKRHLQTNRNFQNFIYKTLFGKGQTYKYLIDKSISFHSERYPIVIERYKTIIGNVNLYITPELYSARNKSFLKNLNEITPPLNVTSSDLARFRTQLNDPDFSVSKIYGFKNIVSQSNYIFNFNDFFYPDFKVFINIKTDKKVNDVFKKTLESTFSLTDNENVFSTDQKVKTIKEEAPEKIETDLQGQSGYLKKLSEKVNLKSLTHAYENFFLYDLDNVIKPTFTTELQKEFSIYGLISFSGETKKDNKLELVSPQNRLKFEITRDIYKKDMKFELSKVHSKKTFNIVGDHILNFSMLRTKKQNRIGQKRNIGAEIIDTIHILGIQNTEFNFLNPVHISINSDVIIQQLTKYKNHRYRFVLQSFLFSSNIENNTDVILLVSNGLNNAKKALIKKNLETTLGVCYLTEIKDWDIIKGQSKRSQVVFSDSEEIARETNHLAFAFTTKNISDLLNFSVTLVDGSNNIIKFPATEKKLPIINFKIQIIK